MNKSTSRRYGVDAIGIEISPYDLNLIKSNALQILLDEHGCEPAAAWSKAVIMHLNKAGYIRPKAGSDEAAE